MTFMPEVYELALLCCTMCLAAVVHHHANVVGTWALVVRRLEITKLITVLFRVASVHLRVFSN